MTIFEVEIERILPGGAGLAHADGRTLFVPLAAPGDRVLVQIQKTRGKVAFAEIAKVTEPSPFRISPPCIYFGKCGGCDFQHLSYRAQLDAKVSIIKDCLRRIGRIDFEGGIPIAASPVEWSYRSRAQWQYDAVRGQVGYYERGTHRICDVLECPVLVPALQEKLSEIRKRLQGGEPLPETKEFQAMAGDEFATLAPPLDESYPREVTRRIGGENYHFSADSFFQINHELLESLIRAAVNDERGNFAVDLYCGVGLFTIPLARRFSKVSGIEGNPAAIKYARKNAEIAGLKNTNFECAPVGHWLKKSVTAGGPIDYMLVDPPRSGLEKGVVESIINLRPRRMTYVSCDPATLARDLKSLIENGYELNSVAAFDMFPQTHHVETVVHLSI